MRSDSSSNSELSYQFVFERARLDFFCYYSKYLVHINVALKMCCGWSTKLFLIIMQAGCEQVDLNARKGDFGRGMTE